ncbi:MAG: trypsin-like peptidase domain-containing protein [Pirellulaceae bacterium]
MSLLFVKRLPLLKPLLIATLVLSGLATSSQADDLALASNTVQSKMVKIYGAGGLKGLEAYQSGFLISGDGHILTVWSYVLDTDYITIVLNDGRKFEGKIVGADPRLEMAVLKIDSQELDHFSLSKSIVLQPGARILTISNLFGVATGNEPCSVLHGIVAATTSLNARRGAFKSPYQGPIYVLDAISNNPGAAGGALTDSYGNLAGLLGKELRNAQNGTWLNYALPIAQLTTAVEDIIAGRTRPRSFDETVNRPDNPHTLKSLGIRMVPDVLAKTPPFVDSITRKSVAEQKGIQPDDLILYLNNRRIDSLNTLVNEIALIDKIDDITVVIQRDNNLINITLPGQ